jgi:CheY-like chemotaxis protein
VIVSDIGMPGEDGYSFIKKLRELKPDKGSQTPAIALTAYARSEDKARILSAGYEMHIAKPVDPVELANAVASLVRK